MKTKCDSCGGTGLTPYSVLGAECIVCSGDGNGNSSVHPPRNSIEFDGDDFQFYGDEEAEHKIFIESHICPDREPHDRIINHVTISTGVGGIIGRNTYVTCERCGCMAEITDYGVW